MIDTATLKTTAPDMLGIASALTPLRKTANISGGEWSGSCPFCGGVDRFNVQPYAEEPRWLCRHCTDGKWQDIIGLIQRRDGLDFKGACELLFGDQVKIAIDPQEYERLQNERLRSIAERAQEEQENHAQARAALHDSNIWHEYHETMNRLDLRELWYQRGLNDYFIDIYQVGYCSSFPFGEARYPTLTIPTWNAGRVVGLAHRALADIKGKYRPERAGLGKALVYGDPDVNGISGKVLLLEGEIKTMVTFSHIYARQPEQQHPMYTYEVVGIAGTSFKAEWISEFYNASEIIICLDPDAFGKAVEIGRTLGRERCRVIELPEKIDDLINAGALNKDQLARYISQARRV